MKKTLTLQQIINAFSYRIEKEGEQGITPIDALCKLTLNALASNRARANRKKILPIIDTYKETAEEKKKQLQATSLSITDAHKKRVDDLKEKEGNDVDLHFINTKLQSDLFNIERQINNELKELLQENYEIDVREIRLSDMKKNPSGSNDDPDNWHAFKGEYLEILDWLIIDDIDVSDETETDEIQTEGFNEAETDALEK